MAANTQPFGGPVVQDRPWVAVTSPGIAYLAAHQVPLGIVVAKSLDGGLTYPLETVAASPADQTGCICPSGPVIASAGSLPFGAGDLVGVPYSTSTGGVKFARSTNGGVTFTSSVIAAASSADTTQSFPVVAEAGGPSLVAVWLDVAAGRSAVMFARSANWGASWSEPKAVVSSGTSVYPWVAAHGSLVVISLYHAAAVGTPGAVPAQASWYEEELQSTDGGVTFTAPALADPTPVHRGPICTAGASCSADRQLGDFQSIALGASGAALLAYVNETAAPMTEVRFVRTVT